MNEEKLRKLYDDLCGIWDRSNLVASKLHDIQAAVHNDDPPIDCDCDVCSAFDTQHLGVDIPLDDITSQLARELGIED